MKSKIIPCCALLLLLATNAPAADVGFNLNLNVGNRGPAIPIPVVPVPAFAIPAPPVFLAPPGLGFSVAVDIPYDMVYIDGRYYLHHGDRWHMARTYNGPWTVVGPKHLPYGLRKHGYQEIVSYRDREYRNYRNQGHGHGHGKDKGRWRD